MHLLITRELNEWTIYNSNLTFFAPVNIITFYFFNERSKSSEIILQLSRSNEKEWRQIKTFLLLKFTFS